MFVIQPPTRWKESESSIGYKACKKGVTNDATQGAAAKPQLTPSDRQVVSF